MLLRVDHLLQGGGGLWFFSNLLLPRSGRIFSKNQNLTISLDRSLWGSVEILQCRHIQSWTYQRRCHKAFLICLFFYGIQLNTFCLSKHHGLIWLLSWDVGGEATLIMWCNASRNELTARMIGRETGEGRGANASGNVKRTRDAYYLSLFHSMLVQFVFISQNTALTNVIASIFYHILI